LPVISSPLQLYLAIVDNLIYKKNTCWIAVWSRPGSWGDSNLVRLDTKGIRKTRIGWTG
jgi:hypothetical protein